MSTLVSIVLGIVANILGLVTQPFANATALNTSVESCPTVQCQATAQQLVLNETDQKKMN
jgi:hypothetical protein